MKPRIVDSQIADENHRVLTVTVGGDFAHQSQPCAECPWRRDARVGAFPAEAYRISAHTAHDMAKSTFACHMAGAERAVACAGFLLRGADHNLTVRMRACRGQYDPGTVTDGGAPLFDSYRAMAEANGVPADDPSLRGCR